MKCRDCEASFADDGLPPDDWRSGFVGGVPGGAKYWLCGPCDRNDEEAYKRLCAEQDLTATGGVGIITGEGYDKERYRRLFNEDCKAVMELTGKEVKSWPGSVWVNKHGWAPTPESLDSPSKRREFHKRFPHLPQEV